jgi:PIN domain nuclease of toxin-antitoxin system
VRNTSRRSPGWTIVAGHNDPTDRMIIAQAITEGLLLISSDRMFEHYRKQKLDFVFNRR